MPSTTTVKYEMVFLENLGFISRPSGRTAIGGLRLAKKHLSLLNAQVQIAICLTTQNKM